jgi:hypothetical protein
MKLCPRCAEPQVGASAVCPYDGEALRLEARNEQIEVDRVEATGRLEATGSDLGNGALG